MASLLSIPPIPHLKFLRHDEVHRSESRRKTCNFRCNGKNPNSSNDRDSQSNNLLLKMAWYSSELLGIAASVLRPPPRSSDREVEVSVDDGSGVLDRAQVVEAIKEDFQRSYFVTGNLALNAYEEDCEFADPAGSFRGLRRFKRNCTNFGSLLEKSDMKLTKWEEFENKGIGHWRFICVMSFPWRPILSGMWSIGMFRKWHCSSRYSDLAVVHGERKQAFDFPVCMLTYDSESTQ
ncbi:nuclear transport factor 2 (NTF2) family protein isoform X2 [Tasmannia lanceolata]|uniref:nuclear transport factor 2 (NTF2) family protein isoform X2 n=1 Tax=Tasmannia lanceolata TaxID=3420 RepID=UPI0040643CB3